MRVVIDTNIWISALLSRYLRDLIQAILIEDRISILFSSALITEIESVVKRPKIKKYINENDASAFLDILVSRGELIEVRTEIKICRDPKDDFILALCKDGNADYLITGDKDLLILNPFEDTQIMTIADFNRMDPVID
jgi:uncharacterized protein